jgi:hypothetical protein
MHDSYQRWRADSCVDGAVLARLAPTLEAGCPRRSSSHSLLFSPARSAARPGQPFFDRLDGALWDISALTKAALARCATARCAIDLMGLLAVREGYYGQHGFSAERSAGVSRVRNQTHVGCQTTGK